MRPMDSLYAIGMMVGLMKGFAEPPKVVPPAPVAQHQVVTEATAAKPHPHNKKSEWRLDY